MRKSECWSASLPEHRSLFWRGWIVLICFSTAGFGNLHYMSTERAILQPSLQSYIHHVTSFSQAWAEALPFPLTPLHVCPDMGRASSDGWAQTECTWSGSEPKPQWKAAPRWTQGWEQPGPADLEICKLGKRLLLCVLRCAGVTQQRHSRLMHRRCVWQSARGLQTWVVVKRS